jgi:hypothetical protein
MLADGDAGGGQQPSSTLVFLFLYGGCSSRPLDGAVLKDQLGTPRGRCDEHSSKLSLSYETKV